MSWLKQKTKMGNGMDTSTLRHMDPHELALHLRHASEEQSARSLSTQLLEAIELEVLPPTVFNVFLTSVKPPSPLKDALWQRCSKHVRYLAIRKFGKDFEGVDWKDAWQEVGGTEGLLDLFSQLSVLEVKELCRVIGRCSGRSGLKSCFERQRRVTELVQCLMYHLYPSSPYKSRDQRPLHCHYAKMLSACTSDYIESLFRQQSHPLLESVSKKELVRHHFERLRLLVLSAISQEDPIIGAAAHTVLDYIPLVLQCAPSVPVIEPHFSTSMSLAVSILERITFDKKVCFPEWNFMLLLVVPLIRRLHAHKVDPSRVRQILQVVAKCLQRHARARTLLSPAKGNLICYVARYWSNAAPLFEGCLVDFIGLLRNSGQRDLFDYRDLLHQVARHQRYDLLRIVCLHRTDIQVDIESDDGLKTSPIEKWPIFIFQMLQQDHSLSLLQRLIRIKPEANFLQLQLRIDGTILSQPKSPGSSFGDPLLLLAILQPEKHRVEHEAQNQVVETLKSKATKSREQTDRAFFAISAAFYAIASGSLKLYGEVLQWTRRFLRDAMTVKTLCSPDVILTRDGIALLGGIPDDLGPWIAADIRMRIIEANSIMLNLWVMAVTSLREPFFYALFWHGPLSLFREVVMSRMDNAGRLENHFKLSEDGIYDILWSQTLELLLQAEEIGLQHEALGFNSPHGPLGFGCHSTYTAKLKLPSFYRFLDNLARSRDALWKRSRPKIDPAVAALKAPWPRGLPIQCLMGRFNIAVDSAFAQTPFMADRAAEVIMADPTTVLVEVTNDKETRRAVGQFIDSFEIALAIYVMQCPPGYERDSRVRAAWSHAINALSQGSSERLSENEVELFWKDIFERAVPQVEVPGSEMKINEKYPVIPTDIDPREPFEWNPAAMVPPDVQSREMPLTILDCMIAAPRWLQWKTRHDFPIPKPKTQALVATPIWSSERLENFRKIPKPVQEGMITTALLIESSKIEGSRILALPFPSETNVRYPSLFLDHDFLLSSDALCPSAGSALSYFINMVPSTLLLDLKASALDALSRTPSDSTKLASIERTAYRLLMLLSKSDRPQLALSLIVRIIIDCPDASSWHRQLLSKKFIRSLSSRQAEEIVSLFASSVLERLEHQMTSSSNRQRAEGPDISSDRYVKVTTIKFLAQFLEIADFVPPGFCVDILSKLFQKASHVDIRIAVLDSMLYRLGRCAYESSSLLAEKLMSALEVAIPVLGSLNERQQLQDVDWTEAEKTGNLPEVYDDEDMQYLPPMLEAMLRATTSWSTPSDILRRGFIRRIVLPVIEKSMEESARWVKMFTLKHMPVGQSIHTPIFPGRPGILEGLVESCPEETPKYILDLYQQFVLTNILPPTGLVQLNNKIKDDIELCISNERQYWLSLYGRGIEVSTAGIVNMLAKSWKPSMVSDGFQVSHVQEMVFEQAEALLQVTDESFGRWDDFTTWLEPPFSRHKSDQDRAAWLANGKPVILRIINRIDALRTPAWQRDPNRQPAFLPPTFGLRLWTLDYPQFYQSPNACATFAQQIVSVLRETIDLGLSSHARLDEIRSALSECLPKYGIEVACCLGDMELGDSTKLQEILLRAELADGLLRKVTLPQDKDHEDLRSIMSMLEAWQNCELEDVRMRGIRLRRHLKVQLFNMSSVVLPLEVNATKGP